MASFLKRVLYFSFHYQSLLGAHQSGIHPVESRLSTVCRTHGDTLSSSFHAANSLLREPVLSRLASGVIRAASLVSWNGTPAEKAELAATETPEGVASISAPLRFRAEETEMCARWRPLRPGTLAGFGRPIS